MISGKTVHNRHTLLLVGCRQDLLDTLRPTLEADGHRVVTAEESREALRMVDLRPPCLLLLDLDTLGGSGLKLCRQLNADPRLASIPLVLMARNFESALVEECHQFDGVDFVRKPFDTLGLRSRVRTLLRLHEAQLVNRQGHDELLSISATSRDALILMDDRGAIAHWSRAAQEMFGYAPEEALGRMLHALLVPARFSELFRRAFPQFQLTGEGPAVGQTREMMAIRKGGEEFPVEVTIAATRVQEKWFATGMVRDVSAQKQLETGAREKASAQRAVLESLSAGVVIIDAATRRIEQVNPAAAALFGAAPEQIVGRVCHHFLCPADENRCPVVDLGNEVDDSERVLLRADGTTQPIRKTVRPVRLGGREKLVETFAAIPRQEGRQDEYRALFESSRDALMALAPPSWRFTRANPACVRLYGARTEEEVTSCEPWRLSPDFQPDGRPSAEKALEMIRKAVAEGSNFFEWTHRRLDGTDFPCTVLLTRMTIDGQVLLQAAVRDITEQRQTEARLAEEKETRENMELELLKSQRVEASAALATGVAREIATSTQFIGDRTLFLREAFERLTSLLDLYRGTLAALAKPEPGPAAGKALAALEAAEKEADLDSLLREIPTAVGQSLEDVGLVSRISGALIDFARPPGGDREPADLNKAIEATLLLVRNRWKRVAEVKTDLDPRLPEVSCVLHQVHAMLLDLITNAAGAIEATGIRTRGEKGCILVSTRVAGDSVEIRVGSTGSRAAEETPASSAAGPGLTAACEAVLKSHRGTIHAETNPGQGTTLVVRLPIGNAAREAA